MASPQALRGTVEPDEAEVLSPRVARDALYSLEEQWRKQVDKDDRRFLEVQAATVRFHLLEGS